MFGVMTSTLPKGTLGSVASLLAATIYHENPDRNHKLWNIASPEITVNKFYLIHVSLSKVNVSNFEFFMGR
jgi:hypothetical protein